MTPERRAAETAINDLWLSDFVRRKHCCLCGNTGIIDTRGKVFTALGVECGDIVTCICPNGQEIKSEIGAHPQ